MRHTKNNNNNNNIKSTYNEFIVFQPRNPLKKMIAFQQQNPATTTTTTAATPSSASIMTTTTKRSQTTRSDLNGRFQLVLVGLLFLGGVSSQSSFTDCQQECQSGQATARSAVNVTGFEEFQLLIAEYLNDPSSSPYGSNINCWDVSLVSFHCTYLKLYNYI
jgi:hypothetical protein